MPSPHSRAVTEQRNPRSRNLEQRPIEDLVRLFIDEERWVTRALRRAQGSIATACEIVSTQLQAGGRLFTLGAGTSGRLAVLDASEMPPTFNVPPHRFIGLIAGGDSALRRAVEGAEDDANGAAPAFTEHNLGRHDVVLGITANGHAPYVLGALALAKQAGATTILLTCNPKRKPCAHADHAIDLATGPELITGSTRLKAGTATKLVLNMISSIAMIREGRVRDNLMIHVQPTNAKLKARACRIIMTLAGCEESQAYAALEQEGWDTAKAIDRALRSTG